MLIYLAMIDSPQDKDKFQKLYDLYEGLLYHIAWNILHNRQDVEDAVQQTFLKILTHLEKIVQVDCPQTRSYVSIVCRYACLDLVNKRGRAREVPLDDLDELALQDHIREDFLLDAFGKLGFPYREILLLRFRHGYTPREIAKLLDMNPETVKKYIQRGDYYAADETSQTNTLVWFDETGQVVFILNSNLEKDVILHIAEGVALGDSPKS